jgi:hypothetical protein
MGGRAPRGAGPEFAPGAARYDVSDRVQAIPYGGLGAVHQLARDSFGSSMRGCRS